MQPLQTTTQAVDTAFYVIFGISGVALAGVAVAMVWFCWRFNRRRYPVPLSQKDHNLWLEVIWTAIPTVLVMLMFWYGWEGYLSLRRIPEDAMHIKATARMWSWLFTYDNGKSTDKLYVPVGQPVKIELQAVDVLHSFYVPAFRVKRDTVPGMTNWVWFVAEKPGSFDLFCAEYCGVGHSAMVTTVEALPAAEFEAWLTAVPPTADAGKDVLQKHGCLGCHSLDGSRLVGPSFQGIAGRRVEVIRGGTESILTTDRIYIEESILQPNAAIVEGYPPAMPSYAGKMSDRDLAAVIDYLLSLRSTQDDNLRDDNEDHAKDENRKPATAPIVPETGHQEIPAAKNDQTAVARGEAVAGSTGCLGCHSLDGSRRVGPSLKNLFGQSREVTRDGHKVTVTADAAYLARAIREPAAEIVEGYPPAMPPFSQLSDADLQALIAWLESLK